jgi:tetratricopeptide (TPR) repeat protein
MLPLRSRVVLLVLLVAFAILTAVPHRIAAQDASAQSKSADSSHDSQRRFAMELFRQNHHLEALPVLEELAKQKPDDADVLFAWGVCLVDHSATVTDDAAAAQERVQARQVLLRAKELGNNSGLLLNLLEMLPEDGFVRHDSHADIDQAMRDGEAAFARNDYDAAIAAYARAYQADPKKYAAVLFIGDSYFAKKDFPNAAIWYERAIAIDPNVETAYRYEADMLIKNGDMEKARTRSIQATVANPYTGATWRALQSWAKANKVQLTPVRLRSAGGVTQKDSQHINITMDASKSSDASAVWLAYQMSRALWQMEKFKKTYPQETQYRHSLAEETDALKTAASVLEGNKEKKKVAATDPDLALLQRLSDAKMFEPYVLLSAPDQGIAADYEAYRVEHREQLEQYLSQFIVPPLAAKP